MSAYQEGRRAAMTDASDMNLGPEFVIEVARTSKKLSLWAAGYRSVATELALRKEAESRE